MNVLQETTVACPYCGESITILVDGSIQEQQYIEDCQVCCKPMDIRVTFAADDSYQVEIRAEYE